MAAKREISIVVPVYNRASLIERCLDSIYVQTHRPLTVYVVDNASTDNTPRVVSQWIRTHRSDDFDIQMVEESRPGAAAARNAGLARVDTEYVIFFDSDDEMLPTLVEKAIAAARSTHYAADIVQWRTCEVRLDGSRRTRPQYTRDLLRRQIFNCAIYTLNHMVRTDFVRQAGGWDTRARVWDDWELGIRMLLANPRCQAINDCLVVKHNQVESITGTGMSDKQGEWEKAINLAEAAITIAKRKDEDLLKDRLDYVRAILAARYKKEGNHTAAAEALKQATDCKRRSRMANWWLKMLYRYTAKGGRAAYYLWK